MAYTIEKLQQMRARCDEGIALTKAQLEFGPDIWLEINTRLAEFNKLKDVYTEFESALNALALAKRIIAADYLDWPRAGGPNSCKHGYAQGIACARCDLEAWDALRLNGTPYTMEKTPCPKP